MRRRLKVLFVVASLSCVAIPVALIGQQLALSVLGSVATQSWFKLVLVIPVFLAVTPLAIKLLERDLVFLPAPASEWLPPPDDRFEDHRITLDDGVEIHAWWYPAENSDAAILYCHGNAGNLSQRGEWVQQWQAATSQSVLIFDYPGYGRSTGKPSEQACIAAGEAAFSWLVRRGIDPSRITLFGKSLGGGVAVELALWLSECRCLVLAKTFDSLPAAANRLVPPFPVGRLLSPASRCPAKIPSLRLPVFFAYGEGDTLFPASVGRRLFVSSLIS